MNSGAVCSWLDEIINDLRFEPMDKMMQGVITQAIAEGMPLQFPGDYTVKVTWNNDLPTIEMMFADRDAKLIFLLRYP
ncbi:MAG TPA: hypothetical protein VFM18_18295 [Methanosarcina sp.]|nr:hypothetical protein [Methanosarcina sp.]